MYHAYDTKLLAGLLSKSKTAFCKTGELREAAHLDSLRGVSPNRTAHETSVLCRKVRLMSYFQMSSCLVSRCSERVTS